MKPHEKDSVRQEIEWAKSQLRAALSAAMQKGASRDVVDALSRALQAAQPELDDASRLLYA